MPKRKKSSSRKRSKSTIKLPLSVVITLIIIAAIVIGVWAALHPYEAKFYAQTWIDQVMGKPTRPTQPAQPIPSTEGSDNLAFGVPGPADCIIDREGRERRNQNRRSSVRGCQVGEIGKSAGEMQLLCVAGKIRRACPRWNFLES